MMYSFPTSEEPIKQGDIFYPLPLTVLNLDEVKLYSGEDRFEIKPWDEISNDNKSLVVLPVQNVWGIVASQSCDASNADNISFFIIREFPESLLPKTKTAKKWQDTIKRLTRVNPKWFYLAENEKIGFSNKMIVYFEEVFQVSRSSLDKIKFKYRKGRLSEIAEEHFRESIAQFFRRYPYDESYPFNEEEMKAYLEKKEEEKS